MDKKDKKIAESSAESSSDSAKSQNLVKNHCHSELSQESEESKKNNLVILSESEESQKKSSCHIERSEISQKNNRDSSLRKCSAQNDKNSVRVAEFVAESRNNKKGKRGFRRVYNAFFYSMSGLKSAWIEEEAFRQIVLISAILIPLGAYLGEGFAEKVLLILPCVMAILAELANSAIENAIDFAGLELHPFAKNAKDMGSAMQLIACAFMGGVWIFYLIERFLV